MPPKRAVRMGGVGAPAYPSACVRSTIVCTQCTVPIPSGYSGDQGAPGHEFTHIYTHILIFPVKVMPLKEFVKVSKH